MRTHLPGHLTGSAWVLNQNFTKVLMLHHAKLNKWLQPGGHADGEENLCNIALRELQEETGLRGAQLISESIFDLDIHPIPQRGSMPGHDHYDVRFAFLASDEEHLIINHESNDMQWVALDSLEAYNAERSVLRMKDKTVSLFGAN
ncbi:MAG: NUDIX hydrolase [Cyclobacteriaceae bacterium]